MSGHRSLRARIPTPGSKPSLLNDDDGSSSEVKVPGEDSGSYFRCYAKDISEK